MHPILLLAAALCGTAEPPSPPPGVEPAELSRLRQGLVACVADLPAHPVTEAPEGAAADALPASDAHTQPPGGDPERGAELLVIARAVQAVASQLDTVRVRERGDWLAALSLARNLRHLGFPHRSLDRYRLALEADPHAAFTRDAVTELAAVAIALGDSAVLAEQFRWIAARPDAATHAAALGRLLTARLAWPPSADSSEFADRLEELSATPDPLALLAIGRARQAAGQFEQALTVYRRALALPSVPPQELAWAGRGMGDCFFALGRTFDARAVYGELQRRDIGDSSTWATYQLGMLDSLQGDHVAAIRSFRAVCELQRVTRWQQDACWQLRIAEQLLEATAPTRTEAQPAGRATAMGGGS